ncbi:MAG: transcription-repair coupling factor [Oscillatoria sp. SIO1A7]|nr:transcription-repair coupling factor [Oscillatoria sp. SIO1A7]
MAFASIIKTLERSQLNTELNTLLERDRCLQVNGIPRFPKGLVASALAQQKQRDLLVVTATLEEAARWAVSLEAMGWSSVYFYPTSEASFYEAFDAESETIWGQMQVLADLVVGRSKSSPEELEASNRQKSIAIVTTEKALQPHLPPVEVFSQYCLSLDSRDSSNAESPLGISKLDKTLARLGYERVALVETEGQWSRRGDIIDVFPVASELPVRLEWFGDELEQMREFDPASQRSLDKIDRLVLTPTSFSAMNNPETGETEESLANPERAIAKRDLQVNNGQRSASARTVTVKEGLGTGTLFLRKSQIPANPVSLLDYLAAETLVAIDEPEQCAAHGDRGFEYAEESWAIENERLTRKQEKDNDSSSASIAPLPKIHRSFAESLAEAERFMRLYLSELDKETSKTGSTVITGQFSTINLASKPIPVLPHQFAKLAEVARNQANQGFAVFFISAQPSRSVSLLSEHDCPAQFVANPRDYRGIEKLQTQREPVALKYNGLAELEGFVLPGFRLAVVTDREFYGQHALATPTYVRKRRRAASKQIDPNRLRPGDFVVHRQHGVGKFMKLEPVDDREYLVLKYADGLLRVAVDRMSELSRFRSTGDKKPQLNKLSGKAWESTKKKVQKNVRKLALDLLKLYAKRAEIKGYAYPPDMPWQEEMEDSFPYEATPDQLKAIQDVKRDLESDRAMDRLVCGDVGFGKTEVAIRAIFKAVTAGKQVAMLAPTTILSQQHYHVLKERFAPYPINLGLLNRFRTAAERRDIIAKLGTGELDLVVGTQSILGKTVKFRDLGLLVVDEEQRFGVNQKEKIKALKSQVDVLTLTATPIPRTLYMSLSGIREMSLIMTPPPLRRPIRTHLAPFDLETARSAIRKELDRGGQIFYVVPRIEGIEELAGKLQEIVPGVRLAIAHGQMEPAELESIMLGFSSGEADILLCTTIVESGLDIPRVNTIIIEDAHRFGLAQLYQLRGRVGRAGIQAHAWMFYPTKSNGDAALSDAACKRLRAIQEFTKLGSGYQLAMRDMEIRGVGNLLGVQQSGNLEAVGFDLYMEMLQESIREIQGQDIPQVDNTRVDLLVSAFIPADYIPDLDQKMSAYRAVGSAQYSVELNAIAAEWTDRYGSIPAAAQQLLQVVELKQLAKSLGFSRIKPEGKQNIVLETPMEEPGWNLLKANLPPKSQEKFIYSPQKVTVRGAGLLKPKQQLEYLIDCFSKIQAGILKEAVGEE